MTANGSNLKQCKAVCLDSFRVGTGVQDPYLASHAAHFIEADEAKEGSCTTLEHTTGPILGWDEGMQVGTIEGTEGRNCHEDDEGDLDESNLHALGEL